jgi:hypothetical protein
MNEPKVSPKTPRERVLAALRRKPVDRMPYCEHLVDVQVAVRSLTRPEQIAPMAPLLTGMQQLMAAQGGSLAGPHVGEIMALMGQLDYYVSVALGRDNFTFWGGASPFKDGICSARPTASHRMSSQKPDRHAGDTARVRALSAGGRTNDEG